MVIVMEMDGDGDLNMTIKLEMVTGIMITTMVLLEDGDTNISSDFRIK